MRSALWPLACLTVLGALLAACSGEAGGEPDLANQSLLPPGETRRPPNATSTEGSEDPEPPRLALADVDPETKSHPEVVQILMEGKDGWTWFCTGALVSQVVVVTAAHCLQEELFSSWEAIAPTLKARPRVNGTPLMYDEDWSSVTSPDLGILRLDSPIELPRYAELVDATARVDGGEKVRVATIVRTAEEAEAPLKKTGELDVFSTARLGYTHGYGVPLYSRGGDSGAGMFLVENGKMTHAIIGVEREPDPRRKLDHLSRVDAAFIAWVARNSK